MGELVEGEDASSGCEDSLSGGLCESECADGELGDLEDPVVIDDGGDDNDGPVLVFPEVLHDAGDADGVFGGVGLLESLEDGGVKLGVGSAGEEAVQLREILRGKRTRDRSLP